MKRAGQAEGGLIGADSCTHTGAVDQPTQGCKLSCFASLALPQDPAVGRACGEQGTTLGAGPRAGRTRVWGDAPCLGVSGQRHVGTHPTGRVVRGL